MPTKSIISDAEHNVGGVYYLRSALKRFPNKGIAIYHRCSSPSQAGGKGRPKLEARTELIMNEVREAAPRKLKHLPFRGIEEGKFSNKRPVLLEAAEYAHKRNLILVAADLSRFIRSESYDRRKNSEAIPTEDEFDQLHEFTLQVPLATMLHPRVSEAGRHRLATRRGNCGRPRTLDDLKAWKILDRLGMSFGGFGTNSRKEWDVSVPVVAKQMNVNKAQIYRLLDSLVPPEAVGGETDVRWKDLSFPGKLYRKLYLE